VSPGNYFLLASRPFAPNPGDAIGCQGRRTCHYRIKVEKLLSKMSRWKKKKKKKKKEGRKEGRKEGEDAECRIEAHREKAHEDISPNWKLVQYLVYGNS